MDVQSYSPCGANVHLNTCFLGPPESILQTASRSVRPFLHSSRQNVPILYNGPPPPENCPFAWWIWTGDPSNTSFLGPTRVYNPNGMSIGSAIFAGLAIVTGKPTDRPTDRPRYSVCKNRLRCGLIIEVVAVILECCCRA